MVAKALSVPANDRLGLYDDESISPARPESGQGDPVGAIHRGEVAARINVLVDRQLLVECEFNDRLRAPTPEKGPNRSERDRDDSEQESHPCTTLREPRVEVESES